MSSNVASLLVGESDPVILYCDDQLKYDATYLRSADKVKLY